MAATIQMLRTSTPGAMPAGLDPGQVGFNLASGLMFVGVDGADILVNGVAVASYGGPLTIFDIACTVPAKPAASKGYAVYRLNDPPAGATTAVYSGPDDQTQAAGGVGFSAKITAYLIASDPNVSSAADLNPGDTFVATDAGNGPQVDVQTGSYIYDGTNWIALGGGSLPDASARTGVGAGGTGGTKGVVYLARDIDVAATGSAGAVAGDPLAVATAAQLKATNDTVASLMGGTALLGSYDASTSGIDTLGPEASVAGRGGLAVAGKLSAGTGLHEGDFFIVVTPGTIAGESAAINVAADAGDTLMYDGTDWVLINSGPTLGGATLNALTDVAAATDNAVVAANQGALLVRDTSVAGEGLPGAWKRVNVLDLGTF